MPTVDLAAVFGMKPEAAIRYLEQKGYAIGFDWRDVWAQAHARAFTVAGVMKLDVLQDIRNALTKALSEGRTQRDFERELRPVLEAKGWWGKGLIVDESTGEVTGKRLNPRRLETIFRTNTQSAFMAGRYQAMLANAEDCPYWEYSALMDSRTRPAHAALHGRVYRYDDPFWQHFFPPNGWNCRCQVRARTEADIQRLGLTVSRSEGRLQTVERPVGPGDATRPAVAFDDPASGLRFLADAGFDYNPGRVAWQPELDSYAPDVARQYVQGVLTGPDFAREYRGLEQQVGDGLDAGASVAELRETLAVGQRYPVGILAPAEMERLGSLSRTVWLSDDTLVKQFAHRDGQPVGLADYWRVQQVLERPDLVLPDGEQHLKLLRQAGRWWVAVVKATRTGKAVFLQSFYSTTQTTVDRLKRQAEKRKGK